MCGRFTQYQSQVRYLEQLNWQAPLAFEPDDEPIDRYNVAPTTRVQLMHLDEDGLRMSAAPWGYAPHWARGTGKRPPAINARLETAGMEAWPLPGAGEWLVRVGKRSR